MAPSSSTAIHSLTSQDNADVDLNTDEAYFADSHDANPAFDPLPHLDYSLQWADLFELDFGNFVSHDNNMETFYFDSQIPSDPAGGGLADTASQDHVNINTDHRCTAQTALDDPSEILNKAKVLLRHFQDTVIHCMAGLPHRAISPYKTLNLAAAVQTLAELTFLGHEESTHASLANLYAILACSAHHLATGPTPLPRSGFEDWTDITQICSGKALNHLQQSLSQESGVGPRKAKYKDQLMAILSLTAYSISAGRQKDARKLLLDAERLLRTRGLAKRHISRRMRMLHHVYTWIRILGESLYVLHDTRAYQQLSESLPSRRPLRRGSSSTKSNQAGANARLDDFLRMDTNSEDLEDDGQKDPGEGLLDIHLDDPREDSATMYMEIYGLPETWLSLVSQTTRLANVIDTWRVGHVDVPTWFRDAVQSRTERLENMVCTFASKEPQQDPGTPHFHMLQALNAALVIFFYRRIRDVNPFIVQSYVQNVVSALRDFDATIYEQGGLGPGTGWPAFIAACEATSSAARGSLVSWLDRAYTKSGIDGFRVAAEVARKVWDQRDGKVSSPLSVRSSESGKPPALSTWATVSRDSGTWAMVC